MNDEQIIKKLGDLIFEGLSDLDTNNEQFRLNVRVGLHLMKPLFKLMLERHGISDPSEIDTNEEFRRIVMIGIDIMKPLFKYALELS